MSDEMAGLEENYYEGYRADLRDMCVILNVKAEEASFSTHYAIREMIKEILEKIDKLDKKVKQ